MAKIGKQIVAAIRAHIQEHGVGIPPLTLVRSVLGSTAPRVVGAFDQALDDLLSSGRIEFDQLYQAWTLSPDKLPPGYTERREEAQQRALALEVTVAIQDLDMSTG